MDANELSITITPQKEISRAKQEGRHIFCYRMMSSQPSGALIYSQSRMCCSQNWHRGNLAKQF